MEERRRRAEVFSGRPRKRRISTLAGIGEEAVAAAMEEKGKTKGVRVWGGRSGS